MSLQEKFALHIQNLNKIFAYYLSYNCYLQLQILYNLFGVIGEISRIADKEINVFSSHYISVTLNCLRL